MVRAMTGEPSAECRVIPVQASAGCTNKNRHSVKQKKGNVFIVVKKVKVKQKRKQVAKIRPFATCLATNNVPKLTASLSDRFTIRPLH